MGYATTVLRLVTGATMVAHGLQKLSPSLGGGPEMTGESFEKMGFGPGKEFGMATAIAETAGGSLMAMGLATPFGCALVSGVMSGAIAKVHYKNGFWNSQRGFEYNLNILAATFAIAAAGGGQLTLDGLRGKKHRGLGWAVFQLGAGVAAAWASLYLTDQQPSLTGAPSSGPTADPGPLDRHVDLRGAHEPGVAPGPAGNSEAEHAGSPA